MFATRGLCLKDGEDIVTFDVLRREKASEHRAEEDE
jgi:hypothetical protein